MKPNFCFLAAAKGYFAFKSMGVGMLKEVTEAPHLQELCLQLPPQPLPCLHFSQDLSLQPAWCSALMDFFLEHAAFSAVVAFFGQA
ncbi:hypothetical protein [Terrimonas sp.]|uniref:hypothetical protein n=1 Tax=Terrimonas sp. TaxID=1914338 RepID=UPI0012F754FD|nr:hypothetical protein [Terrimonas sp.]MBS1749281.1 hypothetical protein [Bacteroidota bacterium]MBX3255617.1 hypothetical protein [Chitinophagaceae bacterium]